MKVKDVNTNSKDFPMLTKYSVCNPGKIQRMGKLLINSCTQISKDTPDIFKISSVTVRNTNDVFSSSHKAFHFADINSKSRLSDMNALKPSQSLDLTHFKRHDVKLKAPYFEAYQEHLGRNGFGKDMGAFTKIANSIKTSRVDEDLRAREFHMTKRQVKIASSNRRSLRFNN